MKCINIATDISKLAEGRVWDGFDVLQSILGFYVSVVIQKKFFIVVRILTMRSS